MAEEETFSLDFRYNFGGSFTLDIWPEILDFGLVAEEETFSLDFRHNFGGSSLDIWPALASLPLATRNVPLPANLIKYALPWTFEVYIRLRSYYF